jgi:hypothetical protein
MKTLGAVARARALWQELAAAVVEVAGDGRIATFRDRARKEDHMKLMNPVTRSWERWQERQAADWERRSAEARPWAEGERRAPATTQGNELAKTLKSPVPTWMASQVLRFANKSIAAASAGYATDATEATAPTAANQ